MFAIRHTASFRKNRPALPSDLGMEEGIYAVAHPRGYLGMKRELAAWGGTASSAHLTSEEGQGLGCFAFKYPSWEMARRRKEEVTSSNPLPAPTQTFLSTEL